MFLIVSLCMVVTLKLIKMIWDPSTQDKSLGVFLLFCFPFPLSAKIPGILSPSAFQTCLIHPNVLLLVRVLITRKPHAPAKSCCSEFPDYVAVLCQHSYRRDMCIIALSTVDKMRMGSLVPHDHFRQHYTWLAY